MALDIITKRYDRILLALIILICVVGMVMLYSASSTLSLDETGGRTDTLFLRLHLKRLLVAVGVLFGFMILDYRRLRRIAPGLLIAAIVLLAITKLSALFQGRTFPARWLSLGLFSFQTSDLARLATIIYVAAYVAGNRDKLKQFSTGFMPPVLILALILGLIVIQPDFSTAVVVGTIGFVLLFMGGARIPHLLATGTLALTILTPVMLMKSYRLERILTFIQGETASPEASYQIQQSLISLGNGGFLGLGLGNSMEKNLFLPTPHTDFIFAIIGEETGFLGAVIVLTLFLFAFLRGVRIAKETSDPFGVLLAVGIAFSFILYAFINAAVVTRLVPTTGLPMPLISYGGSGLVINLASLGILLNISQSKRSFNHKRGWSPRLYG